MSRATASRGASLCPQAFFFPGAIDGMDLRDGGMAFQHGRGLAINERVDLRARQRTPQHGEHGRREQNVAVMLELGDKRPSDETWVDRVRQRARHLLTIAK